MAKNAKRPVKEEVSSSSGASAWPAQCALLTLIFSLAALRFFAGENPSGLERVFMPFATIGLVFPAVLMVNGLAKLAAWRHDRLFYGVSLALNGLFLAFLVADAWVYVRRHAHLNGALESWREVLELSGSFWALALLALLAVFLLTALALSLSRRIPAVVSWALFFLAFSLALLGNGWHAWAAAKNQADVLSVDRLLPWDGLFRSNRLMGALGVKVVSFGTGAGEWLQVDGIFDCPKRPLELGNVAEGPRNIVMITVGGLRADMLTSRTMPKTSALARRGVVFAEHFSAGNAARPALFGLFYGVPPSLERQALERGASPLLIETLQKRSYELGIFSAKNLDLAGLQDLRTGVEGEGTPAEKDVFAVEAFENWLSGGRDARKSFFAFLYLGSVRERDFPRTMKAPFRPCADRVSWLELDAETDPRAHLNRYKNAAAWADDLVARAVADLKQAGLLDSTVLVITSDHGEEMNDSGLGFWGHNGNFSRAQIQVPLVLLWPGMEPARIEWRTTAYDLTATLMRRVLGVKNELPDFTAGVDLFSAEPRKGFCVGSLRREGVVNGPAATVFDPAGWTETFTIDKWKKAPGDPSASASALSAKKAFLRVR